jgi:DNA-binding transcriptional MerR regulator
VVSAAVGRRGASDETMSIGEVLAILRQEFSDITISKIRFLEEQGLVEPERTRSGYRKFSHGDIERLRFVLSRQRDHYLPLRVIREHLDALDAGVEPPPLPGGPSRVPRLVEDDARSGSVRVTTGSREARLSREELLDTTEAPASLVSELESYGLLAPHHGTSYYDADAVAVVRAAAGLAAFGIGPRHLRAFRSAADREAGLVEQVVAPLRRQRGTEAYARAEETSCEVAALCVQLHAALVRAALDRGRS